MYAVVMPVISLLGLIGNVTSICVLHHRDIKLKKYFVDVLSALAGFDILFLLTNFILITFPNWGIGDYDRIWGGTVVHQLKEGCTKPNIIFAIEPMEIEKLIIEHFCLSNCWLWCGELFLFSYITQMFYGIFATLPIKL